jgi:hypothetical protein
MLTREQLTVLDKDALIEIVLEQSTRIVALETRVLDLEARLSQNSKNSSKPPSCDSLFPQIAPKPKSIKKSGGQPGHKGHGLSRVESVDHHQIASPESCTHCGFSLEEAAGESAGSWQVFDLPTDLKIEVTQYQRKCRRCPWCDNENEAACEDLRLLPFGAWLSDPVPHSGLSLDDAQARPEPFCRPAQCHGAKADASAATSARQLSSYGTERLFSFIEPRHALRQAL